MELYHEIIVESSPPPTIGSSCAMVGCSRVCSGRLPRVMVVALLGQWSVDFGVKSEILNKSLKYKWQNIINEKEKTIASDVLNLSSSEKCPLGGIVLVDTKKMRDETDRSESAGNCLEVNDIEPINTRPDPKEIEDLTQEETEIHNKLFAVLNDYQDKTKISGATYMNSVCLNSILEFLNEEIYEYIKKTFDIS
ncbi:hypothetical protein F8M41_003864 [Gigaspora margarita]|uniref:Uncharacterized protein n=1 Tax=Gigaspora margarita TaxID=4874 RepID=A0A8H4A5W7_GIGMA|nr:hypothetical protein F8M41_003864 [Gigaspora margarita]